MATQSLMLIDGNSIVNRAFFALPMLNDRQGHNVNAVFGFVNILLKALNAYKPDKLIVAFDKHGHNFRKDIYPDYKANRHGMPDDLAAQMPVLHELLEKLHVSVVEKAGIEADDIIGTISKSFGGNTYVLSGDRDMLQLVSDNVTVILTKKGVSEVEKVDSQNIKELYGLSASQIVDYKALRGDTSDNIPGVKGIGEKTATSLLAEYGNLDELYRNTDKLKGALKTKIVEGKEMAYVSRTLATIVTNADVEFDLDNCPLPVETSQAKQMLTELQFTSVIGKMNFDGVQTITQASATTQQVATLAALEQVVEDCKNSPYFAFHLDGETPYLCYDASVQYKVVTSDSFLDELTFGAAMECIAPLLESQTPKAVFDVKSLRHVLSSFGADIAAVEYDVGIMQYLTDFRASKDAASFAAAFGYDESTACVAIFVAVPKLSAKLDELNCQSLYTDVEFPLADLLYRMECEGVKVDMQRLAEMSADLSQKATELTESIYDLAGETFNLNSTKQLNYVLFEKLSLPHGKKTQRGYATDSEALEFLSDKHPIAQKLLEWRKVTKLLNTYVDGLKPLVKNGLVHTTFNQTLTTTGRLSSSDPNLQNIPVRDEVGREIRKLFLPKYGVFVGADYSQIELRLLAAISQDKNLLDCFIEGKDIHAMVAAELMGVPVEMVNHDMRRMAKAVNFGIIYGISDFGLSHNTNVSMSQAKQYIQKYFERFPTIKGYLDGSVQFAKQHGYVETLFNRRRYIPEINSSNYNVRNFGERAAMNMPLQGTAADVMKIAMLKVDKALQNAGLKSKIVLQVHDELIVDCYPEEAEKVKAIVKAEMENAVSLACPLTAETEEGASLYEA